MPNLPALFNTPFGEGTMIDLVGDRYRLLIQGEQTGGGYALLHATVQPGGGPPPHTHTREQESFYVLKGEITFETGGKRIVSGAGDFVHLAPGHSHRFVNTGAENAEMLVLVAPSGIEEMFKRVGSKVIDPSTPITPPSPSEIETLLRIAPEYGITIHPPSN